MAGISISETNPYEDALFLIRVQAASREPAHIRMKNIKFIMDEFEKVMAKLVGKKIVPLADMPTGVDE